MGSLLEEIEMAICCPARKCPSGPDCEVARCDHGHEAKAVIRAIEAAGFSNHSRQAGDAMTHLSDVEESIFLGLARGDDTRTIAYYALKAVEKSGFQIVPVEATREMIHAINDAEFGGGALTIWQAALSAAPKLSLESEKL